MLQGLIWINLCSFTLIRKHYKTGYFLILLMPAVHLISRFFIDGFPFGFTFNNLVFPLLCVLAFNLHCYFYPVVSDFLIKAGYEVKGIADGFTSRPYYMGAFNFTQKEASEFAKALEKFPLTKSYFHEDRIIMIISKGLFWYFPFIKPNLDKCTYFEIVFSGKLSIHIAEKDYKQFESELTFDELCHNLGDLFWRLFKIHKEQGFNKMMRELGKNSGMRYAKRLAAEEKLKQNTS
jgi:hypothetical protein